MSRHRIVATVLALAVVLVSGAMLAAPEPAAAKPSACKRWGDQRPDDLTRKQARKAIRCLLNEKRKRRGLRPLEQNRRLERAAQRHTEEMVRNGCFAHECPGEPTLDSRLRLIDYLVGDLLRWAFGENIAWGSGELGTPRAMVAAWMESPGHRANLLRPFFEEIGVGFVARAPTQAASAGTYTTDFGMRRRQTSARRAP
jgi:uncharacterized protein YkwD